MPVGLRTNSIAVGTPAAERIPASCPAPVGSTGTPPSSGREPVAQPARRSRSRRSRTPRRPPPLPASRDTSATTARTGVGVGAAGVEPGGDGGRDRVHAVGLDPHLADGGDRPVPLGRRPRGRDRRRPAAASGRRGPPAGWCRRGWPGRRGRAASGRAAGSSSHTDGCADVDQGAALLDVQLDEGADPARASRRRARPVAGRCPAAAIASAMRHAVGVAQRRGRGRRRARRSSAATRRRRCRTGAPSSSPKQAIPIGRQGSNPSPAAASSAANADTTPERAVEGAAVRHRVEVAAEHQPRRAGGDRGVRVARPGPQVAGAVGGDVQPARLRLRR